MSVKNTTKNDNKLNSKKSQHKWLKRIGITLAAIFTTFIVLIIAAIIWFQVSPWPGSMLIRYVFDKGGQERSQLLQKHVPDGITTQRNLQYRLHDEDAFLDVSYPKDTHSALPTVVWVHGGAWVSGNKDDTDSYLKILAARGYTTVSVDYSIAPEHTYPTPLLQLNDALAYLHDNADRLNIDTNNIVLAGDSAGSQIVAQMATIITSESYAQKVGITPLMQPQSLKATLLNCGAYDLSLPDYSSGLSGWFLHTVLWAYSGEKDFLNDPKMKQASVVNYVTADFPPSFITAGNADPLEEQSKEFAKKLASLNVPTSTLFYPEHHQPALPHEYQFNLDLTDGQRAFEQMVDFLQEHTN